MCLYEFTNIIEIFINCSILFGNISLYLTFLHVIIYDSKTNEPVAARAAVPLVFLHYCE